MRGQSLRATLRKASACSPASTFMKPAGLNTTSEMSLPSLSNAFIGMPVNGKEHCEVVVEIVLFTVSVFVS